MVQIHFPEQKSRNYFSFQISQFCLVNFIERKPSPFFMQSYPLYYTYFLAGVFILVGDFQNSGRDYYFTVGKSGDLAIKQSHINQLFCYFRKFQINFLYNLNSIKFSHKSITSAMILVHKLYSTVMIFLNLLNNLDITCSLQNLINHLQGFPTLAG